MKKAAQYKDSERVGDEQGTKWTPPLSGIRGEQGGHHSGELCQVSPSPGLDHPGLPGSYGTMPLHIQGHPELCPGNTVPHTLKTASVTLR